MTNITNRILKHFTIQPPFIDELLNSTDSERVFYLLMKNLDIEYELLGEHIDKYNDLIHTIDIIFTCEPDEISDIDAQAILDEMKLQYIFKSHTIKLLSKGRIKLTLKLIFK